MRLFALLAAAAITLTACAARTIESTVPFDPAEVAYINAQGRAKISGQAFMRQNGGGVVTCAGEEVNLIPLGGYARERLTGVYGSLNGGYVNLLNLASQANVPPQYLEMSRTTICDAQGNFTFNNVANGAYFITTGVAWMVPGSYIPEGGVLGRPATVSNGQDVAVVLSP